MSIEKCREEFETWAQGVLGWEEDEFRLVDGGGYYWGATGEAWIVWQASREALVIELPPVPDVPEDPEEAIDDSHMDAYHSAIGMRHACSKFIEAAGVRLKS